MGKRADERRTTQNYFQELLKPGKMHVFLPEPMEEQLLDAELGDSLHHGSQKDGNLRIVANEKNRGFSRSCGCIITSAIEPVKKSSITRNN